MPALAGVMRTDLIVTAFTCRLGVVALTPSRVAVTVPLPGRLAVRSPELETPRTEPDDFQVTALVRS
jgi:hypothetical protein